MVDNPQYTLVINHRGRELLRLLNNKEITVQQFDQAMSTENIKFILDHDGSAQADMASDEMIETTEKLRELRNNHG